MLVTYCKSSFYEYRCSSSIEKLDGLFQFCILMYVFLYFLWKYFFLWRVLRAQIRKKLLEPQKYTLGCIYIRIETKSTFLGLKYTFMHL